jgi:hypothetical protein
MSSYQLPPIKSSDDFENLNCDLFNELKGNHTFKRFGKTGHKQKGIDVFCSLNKIVIQCKCKDLTRSPIFIKTELLKEIRSTVELVIGQNLKLDFKTLYITSTASEHPDYDEFCAELKKELSTDFDILFWGWETIESKLNDCPAVLKKYYPNYSLKNSGSIKNTSYKVEMKRKLKKDFHPWLTHQTDRRYRMIIHSIDDQYYPNHKLEESRVYTWFAAEIFGLSHRGLEFCNENIGLYVNENNKWTLADKKDDPTFKYRSVNVVSTIAFIDIIEYDMDGDEHYGCPHFYVRFNEIGPFSFVHYRDHQISYQYYDESNRLGDLV